MTDRAPFDYLYLSRRLLTDLHEQDEASRRPRRRKSLTVNLPIVSATVESPAPRPDSLRAMARRSADLVSDWTGTVEDPGPYVRATLEARHGIFSPHLGWPGGSVACYRSTVDTAAAGPTRVVLFGSATNVVGYRPTDDGHGFYPSDVMGLYTLLDSVRERQDPEIDLTYRVDDLTMPAPARATTAVHLAEGGARVNLGELDLLFRVFFDEPEVHLRSGQVSRVLIGTPLWVATPALQPLSDRRR